MWYPECKLSVGIENILDIKADLEQALELILRVVLNKKCNLVGMTRIVIWSLIY